MPADYHDTGQMTGADLQYGLQVFAQGILKQMLDAQRAQMRHDIREEITSILGGSSPVQEKKLMKGQMPPRATERAGMAMAGSLSSAGYGTSSRHTLTASAMFAQKAEHKLHQSNRRASGEPNVHSKSKAQNASAAAVFKKSLRASADAARSSFALPPKTSVVVAESGNHREGSKEAAEKPAPAIQVWDEKNDGDTRVIQVKPVKPRINGSARSTVSSYDSDDFADVEIEDSDEEDPTASQSPAPKKKVQMRRSSYHGSGKTPTNMALAFEHKGSETMTANKVLHYIAIFFENTISLFIVLNGIFIGIQADYQAKNVTDSVPLPFSIVEIMFCIVFTMELSIKLIAFQHRFFYMPGCKWNIFDTVLVAVQLVEVLGMLTSGHELGQSGSAEDAASNAKKAGISTTIAPSDEDSGGVGNLSFLRLLRILRLLRVLRLLRLVHFIGPLSTIIDSISNSLSNFVWTLSFLMMVIYMVAIVFTQVVCSHRLREEDHPDLKRWWGSLGRSTLTLYEAILGGIDWEDCIRPLSEQVSPYLNYLFSIYIAFTLLAIMNIITGTFVQTALEGAEKQKLRDFAGIVLGLFHDLEDDELGLITMEQYDQLLDMDVFKKNLTRLGVEEAEARLLFRLLDQDHTGEVEVDKLIVNMVRLHKGAKLLDVMMLMYETERHQLKTGKILTTINYGLESLENEVRCLDAQHDEKSFLLGDGDGSPGGMRKMKTKKPVAGTGQEPEHDHIEIIDA